MRSVLAIILAALALARCEKAPPTATPPQVKEGADYTYIVRGTIEDLPEAGRPGSSLLIHHEAVDDFVNLYNPDAERGMNSMVMPFTPAPGLLLDGLAVGDIIEFTWEVRKTGDPRSAIVAIRKLPADTALTFGKARPGR
ncbi:MAG: copper-binding protein [Phycisphaerales bacterium]|nr:copper-binding protein [Phycisphaerales bacterium]